MGFGHRVAQSSLCWVEEAVVLLSRGLLGEADSARSAVRETPPCRPSQQAPNHDGIDVDVEGSRGRVSAQSQRTKHLTSTDTMGGAVNRSETSLFAS